jgi:hypothetical protein
MKLTGFVLCGIAALASLLMSTNVAVVGPCTGVLGGICLLSAVFCFPVGVLLLLIVAFRHLWRNWKNSETNPFHLSK